MLGINVELSVSATERQVKDKMSKDFAQKLAKEVRVREKEVSEALTTKYRAEMSKADAQWETKLQLQRVEIAKLREAGGEASAEVCFFCLLFAWMRPACTSSCGFTGTYRIVLLLASLTLSLC